MRPDHDGGGRQPNQAWISFISGGIAGAVAKTVVAPLDRVKILYQVSHSERFTFNGALRSGTEIIRSEGMIGLWKGNTATLLRIIPYAAIQYSCFEQFQRIWMRISGLDPDRDRGHQISGVGRFLSGSGAGAVSVICTYPLDLLRTRMAIDHEHPIHRLGHLKKITAKIMADRGLLGLYTGMIPTLLGILPYAGISFWTFETLNHSFLVTESDHLRPARRLLFGACAGLLAQSASYPLETIRRRMQVAHRSNQSVLEMIGEIWRNEGVIRGLYKGLSMNWIKGPIATGLSFTVYDLVKTILSSRS